MGKKKEMKSMMETNLFTGQKIPRVIQQHFFYTWVEHDTAHGALVSGIRPSPRTVCIGEIYLDAMDRFGFILAFGLQHELLEDRVRTSDDAV